jgi:hypothetical protein
MHDLFAHLHVATVLEAGMETGVPQDEDVQVVTVGDKEGEAISGVIERVICSDGLARYADDHFVLEGPTRTAHDQRVHVDAQAWWQGKGEVDAERLGVEITVAHDPSSQCAQEGLVEILGDRTQRVSSEGSPKVLSQ